MYQFEHIILIGSGIGATPFSSVLHDIQAYKNLGRHLLLVAHLVVMTSLSVPSAVFGAVVPPSRKPTRKSLGAFEAPTPWDVPVAADEFSRRGTERVMSFDSAYSGRRTLIAFASLANSWVFRHSDP